MTKTSHSKSSTTAEVAKHFYQQFKTEYILFAKKIQGIAQLVDQLEYTSLIINRLLVLYFLQKKNMLDNDPHYLSHRLHLIQQQIGTHCFYRQYLLPLFAQLYGIQAQPGIRTGLIGEIPTLALPIFKLQAHELTNKQLDIPDSAFTQIFAFFDLYTWQIDASALQDKPALYPDILAYIFEHSINQKQSGAYYTQEDITTYIASNTIIACLFTNLTRSYPSIADMDIWQVLQNDPDRYIHNAVSNTSYLSEETEPEYQQRQMRYHDLYTQLSTGKIRDIDELITYNLDLRQFADDVIRNSHDSTFIATVYMQLTEMLILDPTCGTGAFLFAALATLAPLYTACIECMQEITVRRQWATQTTQIHPLFAQNMQNIHTILAQVQRHPTPQHFIYATIITHNLYGIDLMQAAVDICQIRLALALLAHDENGKVGNHSSAMYLNIRKGNTLVGDIHTQSPLATPDKSKHDNASDQPFHWHKEFPVPAQRGGFDVIIGNPPYLEYSKVRQNYAAHGYEKKSCGNLYAAVIERSLALCRTEHSYLGLIVPISICGSERFAFLRQALTQAASTLWLANFEIFPCRLFENAFQRVSIILMAKHQSTPTTTLQVTKIHRWFTQERSHLIQSLTYTRVEHNTKSLVFPKFASPRQEDIIQKMLHKADGVKIATFLHTHKTRHFVYYQEATNYWTKAVCRIPYYRKNGEIMKPSHGRFLFLEQELTAKVIMALMNSSLFYIWFTTYADGFHLSHTLVKAFPISLSLLTSQELYDLAIRLEADIQIHTRLSTHNTKDNPQTRQIGHQIDLEEYQMRFSKNILDEVDRVLAQYYSFTHEELDFIINYDIKYRISKRRKSKY